MAPWIASVRADNAIELRHRELHQKTYWHSMYLSACPNRMNIAQWNTMCLAEAREVGIVPGAISTRASQHELSGRRVARGGRLRAPDSENVGGQKRSSVCRDSAYSSVSAFLQRSRRWCTDDEDATTMPSRFLRSPLQTSISDQCWR
jgi:hypothetical protein